MIKMSMNIEAMVVMRMEIMLQKAHDVCTDARVLKQVVVDTLEVLQMVHSSKDLMFASTRQRISKDDSFFHIDR
mgnify:CR=1 FL=1